MAKRSERLADPNMGSAGTEKKKREKTRAVSMAERQARANRNRPKQKREKGRVREYFKGVRLEMKKVVWPTRKELGSFTAVVLATCVAFALLFWGIDSGVLAAIQAVCF